MRRGSAMDADGAMLPVSTVTHIRQGTHRSSGARVPCGYSEACRQNRGTMGSHSISHSDFPLVISRELLDHSDQSNVRVPDDPPGAGCTLPRSRECDAESRRDTKNRHSAE